MGWGRRTLSPWFVLQAHSSREQLATPQQHDLLLEAGPTGLFKRHQRRHPLRGQSARPHETRGHTSKVSEKANHKKPQCIATVAVRGVSRGHRKCRWRGRGCELERRFVCRARVLCGSCPGHGVADFLSSVLRTSRSKVVSYTTCIPQSSTPDTVAN